MSFTSFAAYRRRGIYMHTYIHMSTVDVIPALIDKPTTTMYTGKVCGPRALPGRCMPRIFNYKTCPYDSDQHKYKSGYIAGGGPELYIPIFLKAVHLQIDLCIDLPVTSARSRSIELYRPGHLHASGPDRLVRARQYLDYRDIYVPM